MKIYYFTYETINTVNGNIYIGCHKTTNITDGYLGSGKILKRAITKHGRDNFVRKILDFYNNNQEMYQAEIELVNEEFVNRKDTYNIREGGLGGRLSEDSKKQISNKLKNKPKSDSTKEKMSKSRLGKTHSKETKQKIGDKSKGRLPSDEAKQKMSLAAKKRKNNSTGTIWITNGVINKRIANTTNIPENWKRGRTY